MAEDSSFAITNCPKDLLMFRASVSRIFQNISESVSIDEFTNNWTILKQRRRTCKQLHAMMTDNLRKNMMARMDEFIVEDELAEKFNLLQKLTEEADKSKENHVAWRPPGNVTEHLRALDTEKMKNRLEELEKYVNEIEVENQKLLEKVSKGRAAANRANLIADHLLNQQKCVRSEFEKISRHLEGDIKKLNGS